MRMMTYGAAVLVTGCVVGSTHALAQSTVSDARIPIITTTGRGEVHAAADRATLTIAVETRGATASAAAAENARAMTSTLAALHRVGLSDTDLSTTGFSVGTDYMRPTPTSPGTPPTFTFVAHNGVRVDLHTLTRLGTIIDSALAAGATQVGQAQFTSSRMEEARRSSLAAAVERAHADADAIAHAAGGTLGALIEIATPGSGGGVFYDAAEFSGKSIQIRGVAGGVAAAPAPPTPLAPSDVAIVTTVTARWQFVPGR